jgi:MurNAc alpha-1-phosphate uridylyltransferase
VDTLQAVVLAGGRATRMHPRTLGLPKSMLEVAGRPFVDWQLERLACCGVRDVVMCVGHLSAALELHVGDGSRWGVRVRWSHDGPSPLGTAGALRGALDFLRPAFLVTYGDSYLPFPYDEPLRLLERHADCDGVIVVCRAAGDDAPNAETDGTWITRYDKRAVPGTCDYVDYGVTALRREEVAALAPGRVHGFDEVQADLARRGRLRAFVARERFFEIGSPQGLRALDRHLTGTLRS